MIEAREKRIAKQLGKKTEKQAFDFLLAVEKHSHILVRKNDLQCGKIVRLHQEGL